MEFSASITCACTLRMIEKWKPQLERLNCCSDGSVLVVTHPKHYGYAGKGSNVLVPLLTVS